jgi:beta propeller repeat protein
MFNKSLTVTLLTGLLILLAWVDLPATSVDSELPICTDSAGQGYGRVSGNIFVWTDGRNAGPDKWDTDIYSYDLVTDTESPICTHAGHQDWPTISGNIVVWTDWRNDPNDDSNMDIYGYNLATHQEFPICTAPGNQKYPVVDGNYVVWEDQRNGCSNIYGFDLTTQTEFPISTTNCWQYSPTISGNIVVWDDYRNYLTTYRDIFGYNLATGEEFTICNDTGAQSAPFIYGNTVVWQNEQTGDYPTADIRGCNLATGDRFTIPGDPNHLMMTPAVSGNTVVWAEFVNADLSNGCFNIACWTGNSALWGYDLLAQQKFLICDAPNSQMFPGIDGDIVVWADNRNGDENNLNNDIYAALLVVDQYHLSTLADPGEAGTATGTGDYVEGLLAAITATANPGWQFTGWSGAGVTDANTASTTVLMDADKTVVANFAPATYTLSTTASPANGGSVSGGGTYNWGDVATVQAYPITGYWFAGWSGDLTGLTNPANLTVDADKSIIATFTRYPAAPTGVTATALSYNQIRTNWNFTGTVTGFKIYRRIGTGAWSASPIKTVGNTMRTFTNLGLLANTHYSYRVCAYNGYGNSPVSNEAGATTMILVAAPSTLVAKAANANQVNLTWIDKSNNETGFSIERRLGTTGVWAEVDTVGAGIRTYSDTSVDPNTLYNYRVRASASDAVSAYSNIASVKTPIYVAAPSDLVATSASATSIALTWSDNADNETGYKIERRKSTVATWTVIKTTLANVTSFTNTGLTTGRSYVYRVRAYRSTAYSGYSNEATATAGTP